MPPATPLKPNEEHRSSGFTITLTLASALGCILMMFAFVVSYHLNIMKHGVQVTPRFHLGFFDGGVWFYSHEWPYQGSIVGINFGDGLEGRPKDGGHLTRHRTWRVMGYDVNRDNYITDSDHTLRHDTAADLPGVYYRYFGWGFDYPMWTLRVSFWHPILLLAILPALRIFRRKSSQ